LLGLPTYSRVATPVGDRSEPPLAGTLVAGQVWDHLWVRHSFHEACIKAPILPDGLYCLKNTFMVPDIEVAPRLLLSENTTSVLILKHPGTGFFHLGWSDSTACWPSWCPSYHKSWAVSLAHTTACWIVIVSSPCRLLFCCIHIAHMPHMLLLLVIWHEAFGLMKWQY